MKYLPLIFIFFLSCSNNQYEQNLQNMDKKVKQHFSDLAFDMNGEIEFHEFKSIKYDTINESFLYLEKIERNMKQAKYFDEVCKKYAEQMQNEFEEFKQYANLGMKTLALEKHKIFESTGNKLKLYADSIKYYTNKNESIKQKMDSITTYKTLYLYHGYGKMSFKNIKGNNENFRDSIKMFFDEDFNIINLDQIQY